MNTVESVLNKIKTIKQTPEILNTQVNFSNEPPHSTISSADKHIQILNVFTDAHARTGVLCRREVPV